MFDDARQFGLKYGVLPLLARAISMSSSFHLMPSTTREQRLCSWKRESWHEAPSFLQPS